MFSNGPNSIQHLLVVEDDRGKRMIVLKEATCSIGRDPSNTIVLYNPLVSMQHALLLRTTSPDVDGYLFRIIDGNLQGTRSRNGLIVNGKKCFSYDLSYGDEVIFGNKVRARYYVSGNRADIDFLISCESNELSGFLQTMQNPFQTLATSGLLSQNIRDANEASLMRLASYPELFSYPILEFDLSGKLSYLNPATVNEFPGIRDEGINHPLIQGIIENIRNHTKKFYVRQVSVGSKIYEQSVHYFAESELIRSYIIEVTERKLAEEALKKAYDNLEQRVDERTSELKTANENLQAEIAERQKVEEEIQFIRKMMQAISESSNFQSALKIALQMICEVTDLSYAEAWVPNHDGSYLQYGSFWHRNDLLLNQLQLYRKNYNFVRNEGLPGRTWVSKQPELIRDMHEKADLLTLESPECLKTGLSIPLIDKDQVVAVLVFFGYEDFQEDVRMIQLILTAAIHIGSLMRRRQAEDALRSSHATNRALLTAMPDWMFRINSVGTIVNFHDPKTCPLPLPIKDFIGQNLSNVLPQNVAGLLMDCIRQALSTNEAQMIEYQLDLNDQLLDYEARIAVSSTKEVIAIIRDITERKRAEAEILNALEREKELNELKSQFVSIASHEFRTPLSTILSSAQLIEHYSQKWSEEKKNSHLQRIQTSVRHMTELLNDILLVNKAEVGKLEFNPAPIFLNCFCQEIIEDIQLTTQNHTVIFADNSQHKVINADQKLLRHILNNLLSNAIKYSPGKENIYFELNNNDGFIIFRVKDEGIGIPLTEKNEVFTSFHRASNVGSISGTGLGLSIIKRSVELHSGYIDLESEIGIGTTFTIRLPIDSSVK
ncbi:ATP-binding protein [Altericista sp. CCNU0014]|uniref:ATP-binding protein n=1 Tax=Altericista sp. CCNU0014 TaxID=3082949 RepID=UPI00384E37E5